MARKKASRRYSRSASRDVERAMRRRKRGTLRSGKGGKGGRVKSRKQTIAIALSEARKKGKKVPRKRRGRRSYSRPRRVLREANPIGYPCPRRARGKP